MLSLKFENGILPYMLNFSSKYSRKIFPSDNSETKNLWAYKKKHEKFSHKNLIFFFNALTLGGLACTRSRPQRIARLKSATFILGGWSVVAGCPVPPYIRHTGAEIVTTLNSLSVPFQRLQTFSLSSIEIFFFVSFCWDLGKS